jgi:hypothetical protein
MDFADFREKCSFPAQQKLTEEDLSFQVDRKLHGNASNFDEDVIETMRPQSMAGVNVMVAVIRCGIFRIDSG